MPKFIPVSGPSSRPSTAPRAHMASDAPEATTNTTVLIVVGCIVGLFLLLVVVLGVALYWYLRQRRLRRTTLERDQEHELQIHIPTDPLDASTRTAVHFDSTDSGGSVQATQHSTEPGEPLPVVYDVDKSVSNLPPTKDDSSKSSGLKSSRNVLHIDHTDVAVPAELKTEEVNGLIRSMKTNQELPAVAHCDKKAAIARVMTYATDDEITFESKQGSQESASNSVKSKAIEDLLYRLIRHGPRQYDFAFDELAHLLRTAAVAFEKEPSMLEVPVPCTIYGDIHGQYSDLHRWFNLNGWPHQTRSVFLGDFVDRGSHGIEVVALLCCLKLVFPQKIFILRGNHEEESLNRAYSFYDEVLCRFPPDSKKPYKDGRQMYSYFKDLFMQLPLAVLVGGRVLGMHGGLSPKMESLQAIRNIRRPIDDFEVGSLECDLVWSDPDTAADSGYRPNLDREPNNGIGQLFAADTVKATCDRLNVDLIIRGHQAPLHGYALFADGRMMTLFSAPGYKGTSAADVNMGACVEVDKDSKITVKQIKVTMRFRQNRINDADKMRLMRKLHLGK